MLADGIQNQMYDGIIGIAPSRDKWGFMEQLKVKGMIEHEVIAIYNNKYVQFGSWDQSAIATTSHLVMLKCINNDSFLLKADQLRFKDYIYFNTLQDDTRYVDINPSL